MERYARHANTLLINHRGAVTWEKAIQMFLLMVQSAILSTPAPANVGAFLSCQRHLLLLARGCDQVPDVRVYRR